MKLRRRHVLLYVVILSSIVLFVVFQSYDKYARNNSINKFNKPILEKYLDDKEKQYLIDNNINVKYFIKYIKDKQFVLNNYQYYNIIAQYNTDYSITKIVEYGNKLVSRDFSLDGLNNILVNKVYTVIQLYNLNIYEDTHPEVTIMYYPNLNETLLGNDKYIGQYQPHDLVLINPKLTNNQKFYLRKEANDELNLLCQNLELLSNGYCGGLKIEQAFLSYDNLNKLNINDKLYMPGYSEFQMGFSFVFYENKSFNKNKVYLWLLNNSYRYGFMQRTLIDNDSQTQKDYGIFRYIGINKATKLYKPFISEGSD
ncbi:MAG: hypothetical protein LBT75_02975 [Bacilli bacterium]|jgi:hypothetical protein|nr:hypothetical protein [Bacilli bacterium]